jgi:hypothetical protein
MASSDIETEKCYSFVNVQKKTFDFFLFCYLKTLFQLGGLDVNVEWFGSVGRNVSRYLRWTRRSRHNFVYYPELRQIACEKPTEISIKMGRVLIAILSIPIYR